jgi:hypothetical protein
MSSSLPEVGQDEGTCPPRGDYELSVLSSTAKEDGNTGETEHLSKRGLTLNYEYVDNPTEISQILADECSFVYSKEHSLVYKKDGASVKCYVYDSNSQVLNGLFKYDKYWLQYKDSLSSSGQTLAAIPASGVLELWKLSALQGQQVRTVIPRGIQKKILLVSCDDSYVAYYTESQYLAILDIEDEAAQGKTEVTKGCYELPCECELLQVCNGRLYYGSKQKLYVADLSELTTTHLSELRLPPVYKKHVAALKANDEIVVAKYKSRLVEAWTKGFEVLWRYEIYDAVKVEVHFTEGYLMLLSPNAVVMRDLKSGRSTTVVKNKINQMHIKIGQDKLILNGSEDHKLATTWSYWLSLFLGLFYYFDVGSDIALLNTYYNTDHYLIFVLAVALIIGPNISEVIETPHRTVRNTLAKLLFLDQLFALYRDYKNPTYFKGKRDTGRELSVRVTKETAMESIPQTLISFFFILETNAFSALPLVGLGSSLISASSATSFGLKQDKGLSLLLSLFCYRIFEILLRMMLLGLATFYIFFYFVPAFLTFSISTQFLIYFLRETTSWEQAFDHLMRSGIDSFAYVSGFTQEKSTRFILAHQATNFLVNLFLIFVLQFVSQVEDFWVAAMWIMAGGQLGFFLMIRCRRPFWKKDEDSQQ